METKNQFKLVVMGSSGVGKTAFIHKHSSGKFLNDHKPTIGVQCERLKFNTSIGEVEFIVWDIAGLEKYGGLRDGYLIGGDCAIIMFDVTNSNSYKDVPRWYRDISRVLENVPIILCGNKVDKEDQSQMSFAKNNIQYCDISAKTNYNYEKPFLKLIQLLKNDDSISFSPTQSFLKINEEYSGYGPPICSGVPSGFQPFTFGPTQPAKEPSVSALASTYKVSSSPFTFGPPQPAKESSVSTSATNYGGIFGSTQSATTSNSSPSTKDKNEFKLVLLGSSGVGKTSYINKLLNGEFIKDHIHTIGVAVSDLKFKTTVGEIKFSTWDIAGEEKYVGIVDGYLIGTDCAIIMFDVTSRITYKEVPKWFKDISRVVADNIPIVLCGNKVDENLNRQVKPAHITFHRKKNIPYCDISVKLNYFRHPILKLIQLLKKDTNIGFADSNITDEFNLSTLQHLEINNNNNSNNNNNNNNNNNSDNSLENDSDQSIPILDDHFDPDTLNSTFKNKFNIQ